ncbi:MAG: hypothetical protein NC097_06995 [Clostridium sp.]|nr:hypothetical protein [Prevotella sp.]MCM1429527.1 hypothetical protein [Clostridium sp.]MCM1476143.1 hypothetical protein [Muribaculaceae bacterium]
MNIPTIRLPQTNILLVIIIIIAGYSSRVYGRNPLSLPPDRVVMAQNRCDSLPLSDIEGIWQFPEDNMTVLILSDESNPQEFKIEVVESNDCRVRSGDIIGHIKQTANSSKYIMHLCSAVDKSILKHPQTCVATLDSKKEVLKIQRKKLKVSFNPLGFLPYFWRSIRIRRNDPLKDTDRGLIRIYPSYDGNGSSQRKPRYL